MVSKTRQRTQMNECEHCGGRRQCATICDTDGNIGVPVCGDCLCEALCDLGVKVVNCKEVIVIIREATT